VYIILIDSFSLPQLSIPHSQSCRLSFPQELRCIHYRHILHSELTWFSSDKKPLHERPAAFLDVTQPPLLSLISRSMCQWTNTTKIHDCGKQESVPGSEICIFCPLMQQFRQRMAIWEICPQGRRPREMCCGLDPVKTTVYSISGPCGGAAGCPKSKTGKHY
jgi:hypothetical protein